MAKQNFIAGGYYGKLGETVGQRWKNKRTLRVYVVPHDPKTPAQVRNRTKFGQAVPYAQLGMQFNAKAPAWDSDTITEWQGRMSVAKVGVDNGVTGLSLIPIFPNGYTPAVRATRVEAVPGSGNEYTLKVSASENPAVGRTFSVYAECTNTETGEKEGVLAEGIAGRTIGAGIDIELPGHTLEVGDLILAVSNDDRANEGKMFYVPPMPLSPSEIIVVDDWTATQVSGTLNYTIKSEKLRQATADYPGVFYLKIRRLVTGQLEEETKNWTIQAGTGQAVLTGLTNPYVFDEDCEIGANNSLVEIGGKFFRFPQVAVDLPEKPEFALTDMAPTPDVAYTMTCYDEDEYSVITVDWRYPKGSVTPTGLFGSTLEACSIKFTWFPGGSGTFGEEPVNELLEDEDATAYIWTWQTDGFEGVTDALNQVTTRACQLKMSTQYADITFSVPGGTRFDVVHE